MVGCPYNAKNTLVKNYLWLAERAGARSRPSATVVDVRPIGAPDGSEGYEVDHRAPRRVAAPRPPHVHARAASWSPPARSAPTSCSRAASCAGSLPRVSDRLGELVRTNSEAILAVTLPEDHAEDLDQARRDHLERLPRPRHAHRDRHLRRRRRLR